MRLWCEVRSTMRRSPQFKPTLCECATYLAVRITHCLLQPSLPADSCSLSSAVAPRRSSRRFVLQCRGCHLLRSSSSLCICLQRSFCSSCFCLQRSSDPTSFTGLVRVGSPSLFVVVLACRLGLLLVRCLRVQLFAAQASVRGNACSSLSPVKVAEESAATADKSR
jgi:hypothetical protein